jgi:hypothetical protein
VKSSSYDLSQGIIPAFAWMELGKPQINQET